MKIPVSVFVALSFMVYQATAYNAVMGNWLRTSVVRPMKPLFHRVTLESEGENYEFEVDESETILEAALNNGIELTHDCKLGVCLTCAGKILEGEVDQSSGTLDSSVIEEGYALLCSAYPKSDVKVKAISEDDLVSAQFVTG